MLVDSLLTIGHQPLDFTLLDRHFGKIHEWRAAITEIHRRGMYIILDNTMSTQADLSTTLIYSS